jgi:hypothetical protein
LFETSLFYRLQRILRHFHFYCWRRVRPHRVAPPKTSRALRFIGFSVLEVCDSS